MTARFYDDDPFDCPPPDDQPFVEAMASDLELQNMKNDEREAYRRLFPKTEKAMREAREAAGVPVKRPIDWDTIAEFINDNCYKSSRAHRATNIEPASDVAHCRECGVEMDMEHLRDKCPVARLELAVEEVSGLARGWS